MVNDASAVLEHQATDTEIKGLNPATNFTRTKWQRKKGFGHSQGQGGRTVVEHQATDSEIKGLNPAPTCHQNKMAEKNGFANVASTVVECFATDPEIKGLNPATAWHQEKMAGKFFAQRMLVKEQKKVHTTCLLLLADLAENCPKNLPKNQSVTFSTNLPRF